MRRFKSNKTTDLKEIAKLIADEKKNKGVRTVVITQGANPVLVAKSGVSKLEEFDVPQLDPKKVIDTNGAGDAFTGGFIAFYALKKPFDQCIGAAIYCAGECVQRLGCTFPKDFRFKL
jgi:adenosine kinase